MRQRRGANAAAAYRHGLPLIVVAHLIVMGHLLSSWPLIVMARLVRATYRGTSWNRCPRDFRIKSGEGHDKVQGRSQASRYVTKMV
jgi:hypothetical protein